MSLYKTSLLAWLIICGISAPLKVALQPVQAQTPVTLHTAITSGTTIVLMNYAAMPIALRIFRRWLVDPRSQKDNRENC